MLYLINILFISFQFRSSNGGGSFFVGFLGYANPTNEKFDGRCCDDDPLLSNCEDFCDLLFDVSVKGLDGYVLRFRPNMGLI